jgi:hypothetical protein
MGARKPNRYRLLPGGLAQVELTQGFWTLVDADQLHRLLAYKWRVVRKRGAPYAVTNVGTYQLYLHRLLRPHNHPHTDHRNGDGLDNRLANLRPATHSQNIGAQRKVRAHKTSQYRGVSHFRLSHRSPWRASIKKDGVLYQRTFATELDAAHWYDQKALELCGEFAVLNFANAPATLQ